MSDQPAKAQHGQASLDLAALGLDQDGERLFRYVLATRGGPVQTIADALDLPRLSAERQLDRLIELGLIRTVTIDVPQYRTGEGVQPSGLQEL